jgi:hypothetical protein
MRLSFNSRFCGVLGSARPGLILAEQTKNRINDCRHMEIRAGIESNRPREMDELKK